MQKTLLDPPIQFITVKHIKLAYRQINPDYKDTFILLHGLAETSEFFWRPIFKEFAETHRIIAFDLLGHGKSQAKSDDYAPQKQAQLIHLALLELGVNSATLIGHSLGGMIGIELAASQPQLIQKMVLYSVPVSKGFVPTIIELMRQLNIISLLPGFLLLFPFSGRIQKLFPIALQRLTLRIIFMQWKVPYNRRLLGQDFGREMITLASSTSGLGLEKMVRNTFLFSHVEQKLEDIKQPVLLIKGSTDFILSNSMARKYHAALQNSELHIIPQTSHISLLDNPDEFCKILQKFINTPQ